MNRTRWIIFALITTLALAGIIVLSQGNKVDVEDVDGAVVVKDGNYPDHVYGNADSPVVLIEYGDFQCPACGSVNPTVVDIKQEYKDDIAFVYRHFPLTTIHPNALAAAAAVEAAGKQDKYWEMHTLMFENQSAWSEASVDERQNFFDRYAEDLDLDMEQFRTDMISDEVTRRIKRDQALARQAAVDSTPTFILNGEKLGSDVVNDLSQGGGNELRKLLDQKLEEAGTAPTEN